MAKEIISTPNAPKAIGPYSQAVKIGSMMFCSGQIPLDPESMEIVAPEDVIAQAHQVFKNIGEVLKSQNLNYNHVVKTMVFLKDMGDFTRVNEVYSQYFDPANKPPARSAVEVARLPKDVLIEVEVIASFEA